MPAYGLLSAGGNDEELDAAEKAARKRGANDRGKGMDPLKLAVGSYSPERERELMELPIYGAHQNALQNADGSFKYMVGYDGLGTAPLG